MHIMAGRIAHLPTSQVPITLRQPSFTHAKRLCERLKHKIVKGEFFLHEPAGG